MFCGVFLQSKRRGGDRKRGFAGGEFCKAAGIAGVFPIYRNEMGRAEFCRAAGLPYSLV